MTRFACPLRHRRLEQFLQPPSTGIPVPRHTTTGGTTVCGSGLLNIGCRFTKSLQPIDCNNYELCRL
jgi:hypothetical protein